jgi:hypothetical protein
MKDPLPPLDAATPYLSAPALPATDLRADAADELVTAMAIRRILDQATDRLPYRVSERLAVARIRALERVIDSGPAKARMPGAATIAIAPSGPASPGPSLRWRLAALGVSLAGLVAVFGLVDSMQEEQSAEEMAEVNSALLTDDLPLDAYADRGFGVYLMNTRLPQAQAVSMNTRR